MSSPPEPGGRAGPSLTDRPAAGLYVLAWALCGLGVAALVIGLTVGPPLLGILVMAGLAALLIGLAAAAGYQVVARRERSAERFRGPAPLIVFAFQFALVNALSLVLFALGVPLADGPVGFLMAAIVLLGGYVGVIWLFGVRTGGLRWREIFRTEPLGSARVVTDIFVGGAAMLGVALVAGVLGGLLARFLGTDAPDVVPVPTSSLDILVVTLGAGILVPIGEELFFRGYSLTAWLRDIGPRSALVRATVFFALVHIINISVEPGAAQEGAKQALLVLAVIGPVGLALGWLFLRRGLIAAIAGHAAFNLFGVLILVLSQYLPSPGPGG